MFLPNYTTFDLLFRPWQLPVRVGLCIRICHKLRPEKEDICPKFSKYQQSNWNTIDLDLLNQVSKGVHFSQIYDHFSTADAFVLGYCLDGTSHTFAVSLELKKKKNLPQIVKISLQQFANNWHSSCKLTSKMAIVSSIWPSSYSLVHPTWLPVRLGLCIRMPRI